MKIFKKLNNDIYLLYESKQKEILQQKLPKYYKNLFLKTFNKKIFDKIINYLDSTNNLCCFSSKEAFCFFYRLIGNLNIYSTFNFKLKEIDYNYIYNYLNKSFLASKNYIEFKIEEDKNFKYFKIKNKNIIGYKKRFLKSIVLYPEFSYYNLKLILENRNNIPWEFNLKDINIIKDNKIYPIIFEIDFNKELQNIFVSGDCSRIIGNKVIIPPDGICNIKYSKIKILKLLNLNNSIFKTNNFYVPLEETNRYKEHILK